MLVVVVVRFFFFKQKTAYEMRISDWSSDVCSSDLGAGARAGQALPRQRRGARSAADGAAMAAASAGEPAAGHRRRRRLERRGQGRPGGLRRQIGRASCRERVCQYVSISVVAVSLQKKTRA